MKEIKNLLQDDKYLEVLDSLGPNGTKIFRAFINVFTIIIVIGRLLREKLKPIGNFFALCGKKLKQHANVVLTAVIVLIFVCTCIVVHNNNVKQKQKIDNFHKNYELTYVCAGSGDGEYYTWWEIASVFKPDYMSISNYGSDEGNYLNLLYEVNGGRHTLQQGERVAVPILK